MTDTTKSAAHPGPLSAGARRPRPITGDVKSIAVLSGGARRDRALSIENEGGRTLLTFLSPD